MLSVVAWPARSAHADGGWAVHVEPAAGVLVGRPQSDLWSAGGGAAVKLEWVAADGIGLQVEASGLVFGDGRSPDPSLHQRDPGTGGMLLVGGGARVRPFGGGLWIDADVGLVRTGARSRLGLDAALGLEIAIARGFRLGPFMKYVQIVETSSQLQPEDARIALGGVSFSFGGGGAERSDTDADGLADRPGRCPTDPQDPDRLEDGDGCPEPEPDDDADGILDVRDRCPDDRDGCPEPDAVAPEPARAPTHDLVDEPTDILLEERVLFQTARAAVRVHYYEAVRQVRALVLDHPEYLRIRVEGHADERGTDAYNDWLSTERARRAASWLERFGVDASRIEVAGYGRRVPAVAGRTMHAMRQNRRVRFRIIQVRRTVEVDREAP